MLVGKGILLIKQTKNMVNMKVFFFFEYSESSGHQIISNKSQLKSVISLDFKNNFTFVLQFAEVFYTHCYKLNSTP